MVSINDPRIKKYIDLKTALASKHGIEIVLDNSKGVIVYGGDSPCNGYFDNEESKLVVAINKPFLKWFRVFIHEVCHMHQFIEDAGVWERSYYKGKDTTELLFDSMSGKQSFAPTDLITIIRLTRDIELDCEKRVISHIKKHKLPLDVKEYIQRSNAYIYFYNMLVVTNKWYNIGKEPYNLKRVWSKMPTTFNNDYDVLPLDYYLLYKKFCKV